MTSKGGYSRASPRGDQLTTSGTDDLRVAAHPSPEIARALASPKLRELSTKAPVASEAFVVGGRRFLLTLRALEKPEGWIAAILVPEDHYTRDLRALRDRFVGIDAVGALFALLGGALVLASVRGGFRRLLATTARMRKLRPGPRPTPGDARGRR